MNNSFKNVLNRRLIFAEVNTSDDKIDCMKRNLSFKGKKFKKIKQRTPMRSTENSVIKVKKCRIQQQNTEQAKPIDQSHGDDIEISSSSEELNEDSVSISEHYVPT